MTKKKIPIEKQCQCDNCGHIVSFDVVELDKVDDLVARLDAGGTVPAGECPKCKCLTYLRQNPYQDELAALLRRAAAAIETPGDLLNNEKSYIIEDLLAEADKLFPEN